MSCFAIIPVKSFVNGKSRLTSLLSIDDRIVLSSLLLENTIMNLCNAGQHIDDIIVVSSDERARNLSSKFNVHFVKEQKDNGVNSAVIKGNTFASENGATSSIVIPQDLALIKPKDIVMLFKSSSYVKRCIVICPSAKFDGTNVFLRKPPDIIQTSYDNDSFNNHVAWARELNIPTRIFLSYNLLRDIDTLEDVREMVTQNHNRDNKVLAFLKSKLPSWKYDK